MNVSGICDACWSQREHLLAARILREANAVKRVLSEQHKRSLKAGRDRKATRVAVNEKGGIEKR